MDHTTNTNPEQSSVRRLPPPPTSTRVRFLNWLFLAEADIPLYHCHCATLYHLSLRHTILQRVVRARSSRGLLRLGGRDTSWSSAGNLNSSTACSTMRTRTSRRVVHPDDSSRFSDTSSLGSDISSDGSTDVDMNGTDVDPPTAITSTAASHDECSSDEGGDEKLALSIRNDVRRVATPHPCRFEDEEARIIGIGERMEVPQVQPQREQAMPRRQRPNPRRRRQDLRRG